MKEYETYIFDLYGTLIDIHTDEEGPLLWEKMADYLKENFAAEYTPKVLRKRYLEICAEEEQNLAKESGAEFPEIKIEKVWVRLVLEGHRNGQCQKHSDNDRAIEQQGDEKADNLETSDEIRALCIFFREASRDKLVVYEGVTETLDKLKKMGKGIYLLSNAQRVFTEKELSDSGLSDYFDDIFISSDQGIRKPQKEFLQRLLTKNSLSYEKCVMIGNDIFSDVGVAFKNGMESVFLNTYDFSEKKIDNELSELGVKGSRLKPVIVGDGDIRRILPRWDEKAKSWR